MVFFTIKTFSSRTEENGRHSLPQVCCTERDRGRRQQPYRCLSCEECQNQEGTHLQEDDSQTKGSSEEKQPSQGSLWQALTPLIDAFLICQSGHDRHDQAEGSNQTEGGETEDIDTNDSDTEGTETEYNDQTEDSDQTRGTDQIKVGDQTASSDEEEECFPLEYDESTYDLLFFEYCDLGDLEGIKRRHEDSFKRIPEPFICPETLSSLPPVYPIHASPALS
ncbi:hypothetical protein DM02DRAFT_54051 [Periconia macrospinosa]|uniref:Uncharacterized protein n=1 Tax=Periconia macrospinosa TaxID=97972 RepID=A0A2V1E6A3_9PLEO|nr:hypothetical protein DM02DRAFT_54051 [Periconia macrospinosa]